MLDRRSDVLARLAARLNLIAAHVVKQRHTLPELQFKTADMEWQPLPYNNYWGTWNQDFFMRTRYQIPADWPLDASIALHLPLGDAEDGFNAHPEALIYVDDVPMTSVDTRHILITLPNALKDHNPHELLLDGWTGLGGSLWGDDRQRLYLRPCALVLLDDDARRFVILARNALDSATHMPADTPQQVRLMTALVDVLNKVDTRTPIGEAFYGSIPAAHAQLQQVIDDLGPSLDVTIHAAGHAHIDTAWLWTLDQTRRKVARTFHTALHLMERFPDYYFTQSQPQLYEFIREDHPDLFEHIKHAVAEGRWEPIGGMWVEADCNITGPESLVRQFLLGRRYFREHFGAEAESPVLWLPDTFGFPATLPQIMAEAGIRYFFTTKLRWNEHNDFPYDSFWWEGLDGTRVLAHITPTPMQSWLRMATYNAEANAQSLVETWERMKMKSRQNRALMAYGWGDGGGGPTPEMLENLTTLHVFPGVPKAQPGKVIDFFETLERESGDKLPNWNGELYLETHQGTLTSQAWIKRANRKAEVLLHDAEYLAVRAMLLDKSYVYPQEELNVAWRLLLLNQFHDILPGTSIGAVYDDAREQFAALTESVTALRDAALDVIARHAGGDWLVVNTIEYFGSSVALLPEKVPVNHHLTYWSREPAEERDCVTQETSEGTLVHLNNVSPYSAGRLKIVEGAEAELAGRIESRRQSLYPSKIPLFKLNTTIARPDLLENLELQAHFDDKGHLTALWYKNMQWDVLLPGKIGNQFQLFEDRPLRFDAWNIDPDYESRMWAIDAAESIEVVETGPIRATLKMVWRYMQSTITQYISVYRDQPFLEFRTHVDWHERNMLLKVAFPINIEADHANYHIQWGEVQRPMHRSTSWDAAQYEVVAHHAATLEDHVCGVALLNNNKYAYDIRDNVMRLTLLKSATYPDPYADIGKHEFTYRLYPYSLSMRDRAIQSAYHLNYPYLVCKASGESDPLESPLVFPEGGLKERTIKLAEDRSGIIIRMHSNVADRPGTFETQIHFTFPVAAVWRVNILEEKQEQLVPAPDEKTTFVLNVRPNQIITLLVKPKDWR